MAAPDPISAVRSTNVPARKQSLGREALLTRTSLGEKKKPHPPIRVMVPPASKIVAAGPGVSKLLAKS